MKTLKDLIEGRSIYTADHSKTVKDAVFYMAEKKVGILPVTRDNKLVGVFSERDLVRRVLYEGKNMETTALGDVMTKELVIAEASESYESALAKMHEAEIRHILVIEGDKLTGVLSIRDLLEVDIENQKETVDVLNHYIYEKFPFDIKI